MSDIFTISLDELRKREKKVYESFYRNGISVGGLNKVDIQRVEENSGKIVSGFDKSMFKSGSHQYSSPPSSTWVPSTNELDFYKVIEHGVKYGKAYPIEVNDNEIVKNDYFTHVRKFKNYFNGKEYDNEDNEKVDKNRNLLYNIEKVVEAANDFIVNVVNKYSFTPSKFIVSSTFRDPINNLRANGSSKSYHLLGLAIDIRFLGFTSNMMLRFLNDIGCLGRNDSFEKQQEPGKKSTNQFLIELTGGKLKLNAFPSQFGTYYENWVPSFLNSFSDKTFNVTDSGYLNNTNKEVRELFEPSLIYPGDEVNNNVPINRFQQECIKMSCLNPFYWFHMAFLDPRTIKCDPIYSGKGLVFTPIYRNGYAKVHKGNKSGRKTSSIQNQFPFGHEFLDRNQYFNQIFDEEEE